VFSAVSVGFALCPSADGLSSSSRVEKKFESRDTKCPVAPKGLRKGVEHTGANSTCAQKIERRRIGLAGTSIMLPQKYGTRLYARFGKVGMENELLVAEAKKHVGKFPLSEEGLTAGAVAAALLTEKGNVYTGICLDLSCGVGFCAEHAAIASMLLHRETVIKKIVAVNSNRILPPCGRCRELMDQVDRRNGECDVLLPNGTTQKLRELLPYSWLD